MPGRATDATAIAKGTRLFLTGVFRRIFTGSQWRDLQRASCKCSASSGVSGGE